jgi:hypothetical protein
MFRSYVILAALLGLALAVGIGCGDNPPANGGTAGTGGGAAGTGGSGGEAGTGGSGGEGGIGGTGGAVPTECQTFGGDAACQTAAGTVCIQSTCDNNTCDGASAAACCDDVNEPAGTDCSAENGGLQAECDGAGVCEPLDCTVAGCEDNNDCTQPQTCNAGTGICEPDPADNVTDSTICDVVNGSAAADGVCDTGVCTTFVCDDDTDCDDTNPCTDDTCNTDTPAGVCVFTNNDANSCTTCDGVGGASCECSAGSCVDAPLDCNAVGCEDNNDCTQPQTCAGTGLCEPDPADNVADSTVCDVVWDSGAGDGVCDTGVCELFACAAASDCDDTNPCTDDTCNTSTPAGVCVFTNNDANSCATCDGVGGASCECSDGSCVDAPLPFVCEQFSSDPVQNGNPCTGTPGSGEDECICEKPEFIAVDCELLGNSAALPLAASVQQLGVAFAGSPVSTIVQDAVILPAALICGFGDAGFFSSEVNNSEILAGVENGGIGDVLLSSYLDDGTTPGGCAQGVDCALVSPHNAVFFDFEVACGRFVGACGAGGAGLCPDGFACTDDVDCVEHGTGIIAPFLANAPGAVPSDRPSPTVFTPPVAGSIDVTLPYPGLAMQLQNLQGPVSIPVACIGGSCTQDTCSPVDRGGIASPRVMYDANCDKLQFANGDCTPFLQFPDVGDVCRGDGISGLPAPDCCDNSSDLFCRSQANIDACCASFAVDFPTATAAQFPSVPVN